MTKKTIILLTGNPRKKDSLETALKNIGATNFIIKTRKMWLPEIQAEDSNEVALFATRYGSNLLKKPVIKMDSGFYINGLNGFPGPLVHSVDEQIGANQFFKILESLENRKASIKNSVAYCEPHKEPIVFSSGCEGKIVKKIFSAEGSFIDRLFIPSHPKNPKEKTIGQIRIDNPELIAEFWGDAESQLIKWLTKK